MTFHVPDLLRQATKIGLFRVAGLQIPDGFQIFLDAVGTGHFYGHGLGLDPVLNFVAAQEDGNGYWDHPQGGQGHPPVKDEKAQGDEGRGDQRAKEAGDEMGAGFLQNLAVRHDGAGQVRQVPLSEEGQRELPQPLRKRQPPDAALFVGSEIGAVILEPGGEENQGKAADAPGGIEPGPAYNSARHQVPHQAVQQARGQHKGHILEGTGKDALRESL